MRAICKKTVFLAMAVLMCLVGSQAFAQSYTVNQTINIPYGPDPTDFRNWLDIYQPAELTATPVVMFVHGGAWSEGDKADYVALGTTLAGYYGLTTVVINYRLSPDVKHPAHTQDAAKAVAWVMRNIAQYGGDPWNFFLFGHSAGGHISSLLATDDSFLAAEGLSPDVLAGVVSMSGIYNLNALVPVLVGAVRDTFGSLDPRYLSECSPATHVDSTQPPFMISFAEDDIKTLDRQAFNFYNSLVRHGTDAGIQEFKGLDHMGEIQAINPDTPQSRPTMSAVDFIYSHLR